MDVGSQYSSYKDFVEALESYKDRVGNNYWIRDARTISNQRRRFPDTVNKVNESLKYYHIRLACVKGGRIFISRNPKSSRNNATLKQDCQATIFVRLSKCQQYLTVVEISEKHNHRSSKKSRISKKPVKHSKFNNEQSKCKQTNKKPTSVDNEYMLHNTNKLPCKHIKCRKILSKQVFDKTLCLRRWTAFYIGQLFNECENCTSPKTKKIKVIDENCKIMAKLCSKVPKSIFNKRVKLIQNIIKLWTEGRDVELNECVDTIMEGKESDDTSLSYSLQDNKKYLKKEDINNIEVIEEHLDDLQEDMEAEYLEAEYLEDDVLSL